MEEREFAPFLAIKDNYPKTVVFLDPVLRLRAGIGHREFDGFLLEAGWQKASNGRACRARARWRHPGEAAAAPDARIPYPARRPTPPGVRIAGV